MVLGLGRRGSGKSISSERVTEEPLFKASASPSSRQKEFGLAHYILKEGPRAAFLILDTFYALQGLGLQELGVCGVGGKRRMK